MPVYEYQCTACQHAFEEWQKIKDPPVKTCPKCGKDAVERLISQTAFMLKGGGWYKDLYSSAKSDSGKSSGESGGSSSKSDASSSKSDASSSKSDASGSASGASSGGTASSGSSGGSSSSGGGGSGGSSGGSSSAAK